MAAIVEIKGLTKQYAGQRGQKAIDDLNLSVEEGAIFGFVGPNGAGKTSTLRIMSTLLQPTSGEVLVGGYSVTHSPRDVRAVIGYMPDFFGVYNDMLVWECLDFFGACFDIPIHNRSQLITDLLELVDLSHRRDDPVQDLSRGMKQRLSLARTLIHDPDLLILDEPASGLDPRARVEIRELLVALARMGKSIFFSTHILADVAEICTRVAIIEAGKLVADGELEELQKNLIPFRSIQIAVIGDKKPLLAVLEDNPYVQDIHDLPGNHTRGRVEFGFSGDDLILSELLKSLVMSEIKITHFSEDSRDLEEVFMRATKGLVT